MALISTTESPKFNLSEIAARYLVRGKYHTWTEPRNGVVVAADEDKLTVLFLPLVHLATRYYTVKAQEVKDGKWELFYSNDMVTIGKVEMTYVNS